MRNGFIVTESLILGLVGLLITFYTGAISEAESNGKITNSISYSMDENKSTICKEFYPKIILTDEGK